MNVLTPDDAKHIKEHLMAEEQKSVRERVWDIVYNLPADKRFTAAWLQSHHLPSEGRDSVRSAVEACTGADSLALDTGEREGRLVIYRRTINQPTKPKFKRRLWRPPADVPPTRVSASTVMVTAAVDLTEMPTQQLFILQRQIADELQRRVER